MKKKLACMLLMGTLALSMAACGKRAGQEYRCCYRRTVWKAQKAPRNPPGQSVESTEAGNAGTQQENGDVASALQSAKKAVTDALGDDYWRDSEIPEKC